MIPNNYGLIVHGEGTKVPLQEISTEVLIKGFIANVESRLRYINDRATPIEIEFVFPLDKKAAVYKFEAELNGKHIIAECQEKKQAEEAYNDSLQAGHTALFLSETDEAGDVFRLRLGNLHGNAAAGLTFAYAIELDVEEKGVVRFTLPTVLCARYTPEVPESSCTPVTMVNSPCITVSQKAHHIPMAFTAQVQGGYKIKQITSSRNDVRARIESCRTSAAVNLRRSFLPDHDLSFDIHYEDWNQPVTILEKALPGSEGFMKQDVLMLNFLPEWPDRIPTMKCEVIIVIDRSGSMAGDRINKAREALLLLLKSLPEDCVFNVLSFGCTFSPLFKESRPYKKKFLKQALTLQKSMTANMGGTEIYRTLQFIYDSKLKKGYERQILLLTDGSVLNTDSVLKLIKENSSSTRVFTFGIGDGCSTHFIRQAAEVSNGIATFIRDNERLQTKIMSILRKSVSQSVTNLQLDWKLPPNVLQISLQDKIPAIYKGESLTLYSIINGDTAESFSSSVTLTACIAGIQILYKNSFDLSESTTFSKSSPIHRLAAKAKLQDYENTQDDWVSKQRLAVPISVSANVVCSHTAFVGLDKETSGTYISPDHGIYWNATGFGGGGLQGLSTGTSFQKRKFQESTATKSVSSKKMKLIDRPVYPAPVSLPRKKLATKACRKSAPKKCKVSKKSGEEVTDRMMQLIEKQTFEGFWEMNSSLASLLAISLRVLKTKSPVKDIRIWATALALAYLNAKHRNRRVEWEMLGEKALAWMKKQTLKKITYEEVLTLAKNIL